MSLALGFPALAAADTFCVHSPPGCSGTAYTTVQDAIGAASVAGPAKDRIEVGAGTFPETFANGGVAVDIVGQGSGQTIFAPITGQKSQLDSNEATLSDVGFQLQSGMGQTALEMFDGTAERVAITGGAGASFADALEIVGSGSPTFRDGSVSITGGDNTAIRVGSATAGFTLESSQVSGGWVAVDARGTTTVRRSTVGGSTGMQAVGAALTIDDVLVSGSNPVAAFTTDTSNATVTARHLTIVGDGSGTAITVSSSNFGRTASADVRNTIIRDFAIDLFRLTGSDGTANITISYSDWDQDPGSNVDSGTGSITQGPGNVDDVDPRFLNPGGGDYRLRVDSPLIDIGDPATLAAGEPITDLAGNPRVVDGNGAGGPRRDMGAYEYQPQAPVAAASSSPGSVLVGAPVTFDGSGSSDPDPGDTLSYSWSFDDGSSATGAVVQHSFSTPGPHSGTLTVTDSTARNSTVSTSVTVSAPPDIPLLPGACANLLSGTPRSDVLTGTPAGDAILGLAGNDRLSGGDGDDCLTGAGGRDVLTGGNGNDSLDGGTGNDRLNGGRGTDGHKGGPGDDIVNAADRRRERISCGSGRDRVTADRSDRLRGCERVRRR